MKRVLLIFVPGAHPTYMPPGIASLYASLKINLPLYYIDALDLNIHIWNQIINSSATASLAPEFFKGKVGNFFDPDLYNAYRNDLSLFYSKFKELEDDLKQYLKNRESSPAVEKYLNEVAVKTALRGDETVALSVMFPDQGIHMMAIAMFLKEQFPGIKIIAGENEILLSAGEKPLRTIRREYSVTGEPGEYNIHPGINEINQWEQWRLWVRGGKTFRETLNSEHYLLYCAHERDSRESSPDTPPNLPFTPDPLLDKTG